MSTSKRMIRPLPFSLLLLFLLAACGPAKESETSVATDSAPAETRFPIRVEDVTVRTEVVLSPAEQRKGLMYRESLPEDAGMLFPYREPQKLSFWMANTKIPLQIGYFDAEGVLQEVHRMYPNDTRRVASRSNDLRYALEVNLGWFNDHGIKPGARLNLEDVRTAIAARGSDPASYVD